MIVETLSRYSPKMGGQTGTYLDIYKQIGVWVGKKHGIQMQGEEFVHAVVNLSSAEYRVVTMGVIALVNWMRRFADGLVR